jgi:hypothetical protein
LFVLKKRENLKEVEKLKFYVYVEKKTTNEKKSKKKKDRRLKHCDASPKIEKCGSLPSEIHGHFKVRRFFQRISFSYCERHKTHKILITNLCSAIVGVAGCVGEAHAEGKLEANIGQHAKPPTYTHLMMKKEHLQLQRCARRGLDGVGSRSCVIFVVFVKAMIACVEHHDMMSFFCEYDETSD